jgi:hypothetical protein
VARFYPAVMGHPGNILISSRLLQSVLSAFPGKFNRLKMIRGSAEEFGTHEGGWLLGAVMNHFERERLRRRSQAALGYHVCC